MKNAIGNSVKNPWMENFANFDKTENGGYCSSYQKEVIDFTTLTDKTLIEYISASSSKCCGRFKTSQLKTYGTTNPIIMKNTFLSKSFTVLGFSLLALCATYHVQAQDTVLLTESNTEVGTSTHVETIGSTLQRNYTVKGTVLDEDDLPLPGVSVVLKGSGEGVATDIDGKFEFPKALDVNEVLVFSYIGYDSKEYKIRESENSILDITINFEATDIELMGEVVIGGVHKTKRNIFQRFADLFR